MLTLFLDFCSHQKAFAIIDDVKTIALTQLADHTDEASVMPAIEKLVKDAGMTMKDIDRIAAVTGPGGFMSQRVGMTIASTLAWSLKIPVGGIHLSDLWLSRLTDNPLPWGEGGAERRVRAGGVLWLHSTKKNALFVRGFGDLSKKWTEPVLIFFEDFNSQLSILNSQFSYVGELLPEQKAVLPVKEATNVKSIDEVLPALCAKAAYGDPPLLPWYGRGI